MCYKNGHGILARIEFFLIQFSTDFFYCCYLHSYFNRIEMMGADLADSCTNDINMMMI